MREVINNIEVNWSAKYSDASITQRIKDRLYADWSTYWVADHINVTVQNGKAILTGNVNFWSERREAGSAAVMNPDTEICRKEDTEQLFEQLVIDESFPRIGLSWSLVRFQVNGLNRYRKQKGGIS